VPICLQAPVSLSPCFCTSFSTAPLRVASLTQLLNVGWQSWYVTFPASWQSFSHVKTARFIRWHHSLPTFGSKIALSVSQIRVLDLKMSLFFTITLFTSQNSWFCLDSFAFFIVLIIWYPTDHGLPFANRKRKRNVHPEPNPPAVIQPIPLGVTFSNDVSKFKAQSSNVSLPRFSEKRRLSFELWTLKELSKMSLLVGLAVFSKTRSKSSKPLLAGIFLLKHGKRDLRSLALLRAASENVSGGGTGC